MSEKSTAVLKGSLKVMLTKAKEKVDADPQVMEEKLPYEVELFVQLKDVRRQLAANENVASYIVLADSSLMELATYLPQNLSELSQISGFGEMKIKKYGNEFLAAVAEYCALHNHTSRIHLRSSKRVRKPASERDSDTKQRSLDLFQQGKSIQDIADERGLSPNTIEGHLAYYVKEGKLAIEQLMKKEKIPAIVQAIEKVGPGKLTPIKEVLGDGYSYGEIKYVIAHIGGNV